jgi:N-acetylglutamate synthase
VNDRGVSLRRLEEAAFNAWPAPRTLFLDGWILRFANGYTKRANSANPTYPELDVNLVDKVERCEALYARQGLPCIVRLTSFAAPPGLDELLAGLGYRFVDQSLVMRRRLEARLPPTRVDLSLQHHEVQEWVAAQQFLSGAGIGQDEAQLGILRNIAGETLFATLTNSTCAEPLACGLAVAEGSLSGLYLIATDPARLRQGIGRALVTELLSWSYANGAREAYLQVAVENTAAIALYQGLGFTEAYRYWYRVQPAR